MIPILYEQSETTFTSNGVGRLPDIISCLVTEERNGLFECEFQYPITGHNYNQIREGRVIYCTHDDSKIPQPFDIYAHSAPIDGIVTFNARHISYRLRNYILKPSSFSTLTAFCQNYSANCLSPCPFTMLRTEGSTAFNITFKNPINVREALGGTEGSVLDTVGNIEYEFDHFNVYMNPSRGSDAGVQLRYGKNLTDLTYELDDGDSYNSVVPFWSNPDGTGAVTLPEWEIVTDYSRTYYEEYWTDNNGNFMTTEDTDEFFEFKAPIIKPVALDLSADFVEAPTATQLRNLATSRLKNNKPYLAKENITVDFVHLWEMAEFEQYRELQKVKLCDTVTVVYDKLGVNVKAKVIKTVYDSIAERYTEIELGEPRSSFADTLANVISEGVKSEVINRADLALAVNNATEMLEGGKGGYVRYVIENGQTREILFMDTTDINTAQYVLRINAAGIGFSSTGYKGPYTNAWTIDGKLSADWIVTGMLKSEDGSTFFDLVKGWLCTTREAVTDPTEDSIMLKNANLLIYRRNRVFGKITSAKFSAEYEDRMHLSITAQPYSSSNTYNGIAIGYATSDTSSNTVLLIGSSKVVDGERFTEHFILNSASRIFSRMYFNAGDLSIWTRNDGEMLSVSGGLYVQDECSVLNLTQRSDERLKNVWQWDDRYDQLLDQIEPMLFTWKTGRDTKNKHIGVSAQKLQAALLQAGITDSGLVTSIEDELSVNYTDLSMLLLKRVQEQQRKINDLETRLSRLEALLDANT